eukprot:TRINITY_DN7991_c0_g1_i1.p1 TRINITY_DN7991_c0_g1~~TRINITY_DN7991_c0_g1_i1.p1  ORF type:complete len:1356 (+),score=64.02 TRINITY_DN7991_c0_g1_i1:236-4069(+)
MQNCTDPNNSSLSLSDWTCSCHPPATGDAVVAMAATCVVDECTYACDTCEYDACKNASQTCTDPNTTALSDWYCSCIAPFTGLPTVGGIAACGIDECESECETCEYDLCAASLQNCTDPNTTYASTEDWYCSCLPPSTGNNTVGEAAECAIDECTYTCETCANDTCTSEGQNCTDPDTSDASLVDWFCSCKAPATGDPMVFAAAVCVIDECTYGCVTCENNTCTSGNQTCYDSNVLHNFLGDWYCQCVEPAVGPDVPTALASCNIDECTDTCETCAGSLCTDASQMCTDVNNSDSSLSDWHCTCVAPATTNSTAPAQLAVCNLNECTDTCASCATGLCAAAGQTCTDPNTTYTATGDWFCSCVSPTVGDPQVESQATCIIDECTYSCGSCEDDLCSNGSQVCADPDWSDSSLSDWTCTCISPGTGAVGLQALATCGLNECINLCDSCAGAACLDARQDCTDPVQTDVSLGDWYCSCVSPATGSDASGGAASCTLDECGTACLTCAGTSCSALGQTCTEPDDSQDSLEDWYCSCVPPATGDTGLAQAAECVIDECEYTCASCEMDECSDAGQYCFDPDVSDQALNDWTCNCVPPVEGSNVTGPADCDLDECTTGCITCANNTCSAASQNCTDPDFGPLTLSDWYCWCVPPAMGMNAVLSAAVCILDECVEACPTCAGATCGIDQDCDDPNTLQSSLSDWVCSCRAPFTGASENAQAYCVLDECIVEGGTCSAANQSCMDPNPGADSLNDWTCNCIAPSTGTNVTNVAECVLDECTADCPSCAMVACTGVGQRCDDADVSPSSLADWNCTCMSPSVGTNLTAPATCELNECTITCSSCENDACTSGEQVCHDPYIVSQVFEELIQLDWWCECVAPASGWAPTATARCWVDECHTECDTCAGTDCTAARQHCVDPDKSNAVRGDWACEAPKYKLVKDDYLCSESRRELGDSATADDCARLCELSMGCRYFVYNTYDKRCIQEMESHTLTRDVSDQDHGHCSSGLEYPGFDTYRMTAEESTCPDGSWGLLRADHADMSSGHDECGLAYPQCFDNEIPAEPSECYETCYSNNQTNPHVVFHFRKPVTLTSIRVWAAPAVLDQGWQVYTSRGVNGGQGWDRCLGHEWFDDADYDGENFIHRACDAPSIRSVKLEVHTPYPANASMHLLEVQPYGCTVGFAHTSTISTRPAVNRTYQHGQYCGDHADMPECRVPTGTTCLGDVAKNWDTMAQSVTFCGDHGTCLALPDAPTSQHPTTSTCVCKPGYRLEYVGDEHVTCVVDSDG